MTETRLPTWFPAAQAPHVRNVDVVVIRDAAGRIIRASTVVAQPAPPPRPRRQPFRIPYPERGWLHGGRISLVEPGA